MRRWLPILVIGLSFGVAGGYELHTLLTQHRVGPFELESGEPIAAHAEPPFGSAGALGRRVGPVSLGKGTWLVVWEARNSRRHHYRVEVRPEAGPSVWSKQGAAGPRKRRLSPPVGSAYSVLGTIEVSTEDPLYLDLHLAQSFRDAAPEVRVFLVPTGPRLAMGLASLAVGGVALFVGARLALWHPVGG